MATDLQWGSPEWKTHLRRSLAQRKRHGEKITDIEGLINYIEAKGPGKEIKIGSQKKGSIQRSHSRQKAKRGQAKKGSNPATAKRVPVHEGRRQSKISGQKGRQEKQAQQKGVTVLKVGQHDFI